jgi:phosphoglycolate phosphatase-like HAD superfamily hydrolase
MSNKHTGMVLEKTCFIFDLDKTLADDKHREYHLTGGDWTSYFNACDKDEPIPAVCAIANALTAAGHTIMIVTGRSEVVEEKTHAWLKLHVPGYHAVFMRAKNDFRHNSQVKMEHLRAIQQIWQYEILMIFDDQPAVCSALREAGYRVAQVAGDIEFVEYERQ